MKKIDIAKSIIKNNGGIIKTVQLNKAGIQNSEIKKMCESGAIERVRHGYYQIAGQVEISEEKMIATFLEEGIVCMESALFYYGYSDKTPLVWTIAVSRNISRSKINIDNFKRNLIKEYNNISKQNKETFAKFIFDKYIKKVKTKNLINLRRKD